MNTPVFKNIRTETLAVRLLTIQLRLENLIRRLNLAVEMGKLTPQKAEELKRGLR